MLGGELSPQVGQMLAKIAPDLLRREQFLDFLRNQTFRRTLLTHDSATLRRKVSPEPIFGLRVSTYAQPVNPSPDEASSAPETFRTTMGGALTTVVSLTKAAMMVLVQHSPKAIGFEDLCGLAQSRLDAASCAGTADGQDVALLHAFKEKPGDTDSRTGLTHRLLRPTTVAR